MILVSVIRITETLGLRIFKIICSYFSHSLELVLFYLSLSLFLLSSFFFFLGFEFFLILCNLLFLLFSFSHSVKVSLRRRNRPLNFLYSCLWKWSSIIHEVIICKLWRRLKISIWGVKLSPLLYLVRESSWIHIIRINYLSLLLCLSFCSFSSPIIKPALIVGRWWTALIINLVSRHISKLRKLISPHRAALHLRGEKRIIRHRFLV